VLTSKVLWRIEWNKEKRLEGEDIENECIENKLLSCVPDHTRYLCAYSSPKYKPSLEQNFITCTMKDTEHANEPYLTKTPLSYQSIKCFHAAQTCFCEWGQENKDLIGGVLSVSI